VPEGLIVVYWFDEEVRKVCVPSKERMLAVRVGWIPGGEKKGDEMVNHEMQKKSVARLPRSCVTEENRHRLGDEVNHAITGKKRVGKSPRSR